MTIRKEIEANDRIIQMGDRLKALRNIEKLTVEEFYKKNDYEKSSHNVSCK